MSALSEVLSKRRRELGLTLAQIADGVGVSEATVQRWESGNIKSLRYGNIAKLSKALHVSPVEIMGWEIPERQTLKTDVELVKQGKGKRIPILGTIAAGSPIWADENIEGYTYTDRNGGADYFALRIRGDSMNALGIQDGALVTIRRQPEVENGEIAAVLLNGEEATLKRYMRTDDTITLMPQSTNPANMPMIFSAKKDKIEVLGLAVEVKFSLC